MGFPPDMQPNGLMINSKFEVKEPRAHAVIDTDHYVEGRMPIDMDKLGSRCSRYMRPSSLSSEQRLRIMHATRGPEQG